MEIVRMGVIGYGQRGGGITRNILCRMDDVRVVAVCDEYADRAEKGANEVEERCHYRPDQYTQHKELLKRNDLDAVFVASSWETHVEVAIDAMNAGIPVALEVGGAYSLETLWEMVRTQERTGVPLMLMENCCFGKKELLATSLVRHGVLGDVVHCHGIYGHYLVDEIARGDEIRHYRLRNYLSRNCENYPTHELGPMAKILNVNRGNRMLSLVSVASRAAGMEAYINDNAERFPELVGKKFRQGDIVNTIITCADGSTISMVLDTTLPRYYSREFTVRGTKGMFEENFYNVHFANDEHETLALDEHKKRGSNAAELEEEYLPAAWKGITEEIIKAGHGGMDYLEFRTFLDCLKAGLEMPIDVYDAAAWMSITALSEASIAAGGMPQSIPDFTGGMWTRRKPTDVVEL